MSYFRAFPRGGVQAEFITPTYSNGNKTISCTWDYDAEVIIIFFTLESINYIGMYDKTSDFWYASTSNSGKWRDYGVDTRATLTSRTFTMTYGSALSNVSVLPASNKPTNYYT